MRKVYREGNLGDDDWAAMASLVPPVNPVEGRKTIGADSLHTEMVAAVLERNSFFSVDSEASRMDPTGATETYTKTCFSGHRCDHWPHTARADPYIRAWRRKGQEIVPLPDWEKPPVLEDDTTFRCL